MANQAQTQRRGNFPIDNLTYDLVTVLYEKSKALEAYDKYIQDAQSDQQARQLFEQMRDQDAQCVQQLTQMLGQAFGRQGGASGS